MEKSTLRWGIALLFGLFVVSSNTWAAESSGVYEGKIKCKGFTNGGAKFNTGGQLLTVEVDQDAASELVLTVEVDQDAASELVSNLHMKFLTSVFPEGLANGTQFDDPNDPGRGSVGIVSCDNNKNARTFNLVIGDTKLSKADASSGKAKLKGTASFTDGDRNGTCKWKVKRMPERGSPDVPSCNE